MRAWWLTSAGSVRALSRSLRASRRPAPDHHLSKASFMLMPCACVGDAALLLLLLLLLFWFTSVTGQFTPLLGSFGACVVLHHSVGAAVAVEGLRSLLKKFWPPPSLYSWVITSTISGIVENA